MSPDQAPAFEALIAPYRSLTPKRLAWVVGLFLVLSAGIAFRFWLWGAWPVVAFSCAEVPLLVLLLAVNQWRARASELIMLDQGHLTVIRTDASGQRAREEFAAAWLRIDLDTTRGIPKILVHSHGRACEVGAFLHEPDKMSLFEALKAALHNVRNPRFNNPQLSED